MNTKDILEDVTVLGWKYPAVRFSVAGHVGGHPLMAKIVVELVNKTTA